MDGSSRAIACRGAAPLEDGPTSPRPLLASRIVRNVTGAIPSVAAEVIIDEHLLLSTRDKRCVGRRPYIETCFVTRALPHFRRLLQ